ncbi:sarcosine oxidase subunit alpha [Lentibacillus halodurans]|uniref:Sarcosine oxidase subunit alpha n=1 Tax=Lentibacillus halodurans TaxID=237679 RepID=A0A1I0W6C2_9BACI|nr:sarcosine oxidase subunit alpha [Lentibacillus halodurans]
MRINEHPILGKQDKDAVTITYNGLNYEAYEGESIAAALLAHNIRILRYSEKCHEPRGIYCGIGHCYECRVMVDGERSVRACITNVKDGMHIRYQTGEFL